MALEIKGMTRSFKFKKGTEYITLHDPDPNISPDMVMSYYSNMYPELTTATVHGPVIREDMTEYEFKTTIGTKDKGYGKGQQKKEEIMCTIGRISGGTARETYHCGNRKEGALRHGKKETDCGTQRCRYSFLNATFLPISPSELFTDGTDGKPHNLITQENYEYLRDSFSDMHSS